jgi:hypothetical protein
MPGLARLALAGALLVGLTATSADAQQQRGMRYNCQNGAQMTVIFQRAANGTISLRYVYDGPDSAMRTMQIVGHPDNGNFVDGQNRITVLNQNPGTISYVEGSDLSDTCTVFQQF